MPRPSRRRCLQALASLAAAPAWAPFVTTGAVASAGPLPAEQESLAALARAFLKKHEAPGLSVAFAKQGRPVFSAGYGMADAARAEEATPAHRFRIASVSKPFTSAAIYTLIEQGRLRLDDKVFGALLGMDAGKAASPAAARITVHHLLTHTSGGWNNKAGDPMFQHPEMGQAELIAHTLRTRPLDHEPGKAYAYSNFGYCVLGRVIEKAAGKPYAAYVKESVLSPCGITDMQIGGNTRAEQADKEAVYARNDLDPYAMDVRRMDSHGGWIATPSALVQFLTHVDGFDSPKDILRASTLKTMTTGTAANPGYASGFAVNAVPNWWHLGSLPGTTAIVVRTASGLCWAGCLNGRSKDVDLALDKLLWQMARTVPAWQV